MSKSSQEEQEKRGRPEWQIFRLRVGDLMKEGGLSNRGIGEVAGAAESTVHHWLMSGRIPKEPYLRRIEAHFRKPPGWLLGEGEVQRLKRKAEWERGVRMSLEKPQIDSARSPQSPLEVSGVERVAPVCNLWPEYHEEREAANAAKVAKSESVRRIPVLQVEVGAGVGRLNGDEYVQEYFEVPEGLVPWKGDLSIVSVYGDSMEPTYRHGDLVIVQPESRVMDAIMVVAWDDALMVKRVRRVGVKTIELISDNECYRPITLAVNEIRVVGRVMGLIRWNA